MAILKVNNVQYSTKDLELSEDYYLDVEDASIIFINPTIDQLTIHLPHITEENNELGITGLSFKFYNMSSKFAVNISCIVEEQTYNYCLTPKNSIGVVFNGIGWLYDNNFDLHLYNDEIFGVCRLYTGGGSGTWHHIDSTGNLTDLADNYFEQHSLYAGITPVQIDGQYMVRIPKFYVKYETVTDEQDTRNLPLGAKIKYISPKPQEGFHVHPAFMYNGKEIDCFYIGAYEASLDSSNKLASVPNVLPVKNSFSNSLKLIEARNTNDNSGFMMEDIYQRSAIQLLILAEYATPDVKPILGAGNINSSDIENVNAENEPVWRGIYGLYGNLNELIDGIKITDMLKLQIYDNMGNRTYISTEIEALYNYNWIVDMFDNIGDNYNLEDVFIPNSTDSEESNGTYKSGYVLGGYKTLSPYVGGQYNTGDQAGLFYFSFNNDLNQENVYHSTRLAKI